MTKMTNSDILESSMHTDMEKLQLIFDNEKERLRTIFPSVYYAILGVLDAEKKPNPSGYFGN
jgi:hypothetical protein